MRNKYGFREPLNHEPDGTYITAGQMQFFLNRRDGLEKFQTGNADFMRYYHLCRVYNLISEIMEIDEDSAIMYWNPDKNAVSISFPSDGEVSFALGELDLGIAGDEDDGEDTWSAGV